MNLLYKILNKAYIIIGITIFILGLIFYPFLDYFIKGESGIEHIGLVYFIYLFNYVFPYFCGLSGRSLITANQKERVFSAANYGSVLVTDILQIVVLFLTQNFLFYLLVKTFATTFLYIYIQYKSRKMYPYINKKNKEKLKINEKRDIIKNIKGSIYYNFGYVVTHGTDNLLISTFIGITQVGLYANYNFIVTAVQSMVRPLFMSVVASIGNLNVQESNEKKTYILYVLMFSNFWIFGFSSISIFVLSSPFIQLWIGQEYLMSYLTVLIIIINFYIAGMQTSSNSFRSALGLFWHGRFRPIISAALNLLFSLLLVEILGINGIFIGTILSVVLIAFWYDPLIVFKYGLKTSSKTYFKKYVSYLFVVIIAGVVTFKLSSTIEITILGFLIKGLICLIIPNMIFLLFFHKTEEFKYILNFLKSILNSRINKT